MAQDSPRRSKNKSILIITGMFVIIAIIISMWIANFFRFHQRNILSYSVGQRNISYCNSNNPYQTLDLYRPKHSSNKTLPVMIYIHGGGWSGGKKDNDFIKNVWGPYFIKKKMAVVTVGYRTNAKKLYPLENDDVACALTYLKKNSEKYSLDMDRSVFFGTSAGGQLASFAALNNPYKDYDYNTPKGVIDFYGVSDFSKIVTGKHPDYNARRYLGKGYLDKVHEASPVSYVHAGAPPFLLVHGDKDAIVPSSQSEEFYQKLKSRGVEAMYIEVPDAQHAFSGPELGRKEFRFLRQAVGEFLKEIIGV